MTYLLPSKWKVVESEIFRNLCAKFTAKYIMSCWVNEKVVMKSAHICKRYNDMSEDAIAHGAR